MVTVKDNEIYFAKLKPNAIIPSKRDEDAGYDVYACFDGDYLVIEPQSTKGIPTGIAAAFSNKYYIQVEERGSTGKIGLKKSSGVMDSGYRGEYIILSYNSNTRPILISKVADEALPKQIIINEKTYKSDECIIYPASKAIAQLVLQEIPKVKVKEISYDELCNIASERGTGCLGSSKK